MSNPTFWRILSDFIAVAALLIAGAFVVLALIQWVKRKHFRRIDRELRWALLPAALMLATEIFFEKILIVHTRPPESGRPFESSFPSTHTMVTATIFFCLIIILPRYLHSRRARLILDVLMLLAVILVAVGRVLAHMHWVSDVIGGLLFASIFAVIYTLILRRPHAHPTQLEKPQN